MRKLRFGTAALAALLAGSAAANAGVLLYSFESSDSPNSKDGFVNNGLFPSSSTIGATNGTGSLELNNTSGGGYEGSYTQGDLPATLSNPNLTGFTADVTITSALPQASSGPYNVLGLGFFVYNAGEGEYGDQYIAPTSAWANINFSTPGTQTVYVPLEGSDPDSGNPISWPALLAEGWAVGGFNIVDNNNAGAPFAFYIDNIQGIVPEPASLSLIGIGGAMLLGRRRRTA